ncbi:MAG: urate hydroxylase PuuD [Beijerinckiaceae bacterium]|nr:urate hydroxylase PuuD [Beijerinckiaceae bacterium]
MADINETASNLLEKISSILEKPYHAMALGGGIAAAILLLYHAADLFGGSYFGPFFTFLHVVSGIAWIGLLYYFNLVQIPTMPKIPAELKPGVGKYIAPEALFWFRWAMVATVATGIIVFFSGSAVINFTLITGIALGLIMGFNVWFIIWPNQQKALGLVPAEDDEKAKSARLAMLTSRANFALSIPMLYCMVIARFFP